MIDAEADGLENLRRHRPIYADAGRRAFVCRIAKEMGPRPFHRRTGIPLKCAERLALGRPVADRTVEAAFLALQVRDDTPVCALDGCEEPVRRLDAKYCSAAHRRRASCRSKAARLDPSSMPDHPVVCPTCSTFLLGSARDACPVCSTNQQPKEKKQ